MVLAACGTSDKQSKDAQSLPRIVTSEEAQIFSRALSNNTQDKNASFEITSGILGSNGFVARGKVDWSTSVVEMQVSLFERGQVEIQTITTAEAVFESFLGMDSLASQAGLEPKGWIARQFDPTKYGIDVLSQFMMKLAAPAPENPILLKQDGAKFLGSEKTNGVELLKFQNTPNITYFLDKNGVMNKVNANVKGFPNSIEIVFSNRKNTEIDVPNVGDAHSLDDVISFYPEKRPAF